MTAMLELEMGGLTPEEEKKILLYYQIKILEMCKYLKLQLQIPGTAVVYFKTFFKRRKIYDYDMKNLIVAFVFLAMKAENIHVTSDLLSSKLKFVDKIKVEQYELDICKAIHFEFYVPSPYLRLLGIYILLKGKVELLKGRKETSFPKILDKIVDWKGLEKTQIKADWEDAVSNLDKIVLSDRYFDFSVNELAIASLNVDPSLLENLFMEQTIKRAEEVKKEMEKISKPDKEELRGIDEKMRRIQTSRKIIL